MKYIFMLTLLIVLFGFTAAISLAQCGPDGTQPCDSSNRPKTKVTQPKVKAPKLPPATNRQNSKTVATCSFSNNKDAPAIFSQVISGVKFEMVGIPSGKFCMGSNNGRNDEKPVRQVNINYTFYMGKYEVTLAQWKAVMGKAPARSKTCDDCPVDWVSWDDTKEFIKKLNSLQSVYEYRLPTEAEWEYAARAGATGDSSAGNLDAMAWYAKNADSKAHPVGQKQPNAWGLYDMQGNVWEWCEDYFNYDYKGLPTDGSANLVKYIDNRIIRGGSYSPYDEMYKYRPAYRGNHGQNGGDTSYGFRLAARTR